MEWPPSWESKSRLSRLSNWDSALSAYQDASRPRPRADEHLTNAQRQGDWSLSLEKIDQHGHSALTKRRLLIKHVSFQMKGCIPGHDIKATYQYCMQQNGNGSRGSLTSATSWYRVYKMDGKFIAELHPQRVEWLASRFWAQICVPAQPIDQMDSTQAAALVTAIAEALLLHNLTTKVLRTKNPASKAQKIKHTKGRSVLLQHAYTQMWCLDQSLASVVVPTLLSWAPSTCSLLSHPILTPATPWSQGGYHMSPHPSDSSYGFCNMAPLSCKWNGTCYMIVPNDPWFTCETHQWAHASVRATEATATVIILFTLCTGSWQRQSKDPWVIHVDTLPWKAIPPTFAGRVVNLCS